MTKSERMVLEVISGKRSYKDLYYYHDPDRHQRKKSIEKAIKSLKEKGLIEKGESNILRKVQREEEINT